MRSRQHPAQIDHANAIKDFHLAVLPVYDQTLPQSSTREKKVSESFERAHETVEHHAEHSDTWARGVAVLVSFLAAALAMTEIGGKAAQNAYLTLSCGAVERLGVLPGQEPPGRGAKFGS